MVKKYSGRRMNENPPHIFAISETTVANVRNFKANQAVIISGTVHIELTGFNFWYR
jgi:myosin heavy subunit